MRTFLPLAVVVSVGAVLTACTNSGATPAVTPTAQPAVTTPIPGPAQPEPGTNNPGPNPGDPNNNNNPDPAATPPWGGPVPSGAPTPTALSCGWPDAADAAGPNIDLASAAALPNAGLSNLWVDLVNGEEDVFGPVTVQAGSTITLDVDFIHSLGDIDAELVDSTDGYLDGSAGVLDGETVTWTNDTGAAEDVYLRVYLWSLSTFDCNTYSIAPF